jgi:hypothetical protein
MMCAEAREAILEADLSELEGGGATPLARHLGMCSQCRELARRVLVGEEAMASELIQAVPKLQLDHILAAGWPGAAGAHATSGAGPVHASVSAFRLRNYVRLTVPLFNARRALLPLALAAGLAALFIVREPRSLPGPAFAPAQEVIGLEVEVPPDRNVAILATDDPNITVLWLFPRSVKP